MSHPCRAVPAQPSEQRASRLQLSAPEHGGHDPRTSCWGAAAVQPAAGVLGQLLPTHTASSRSLPQRPRGAGGPPTSRLGWVSFLQCHQPQQSPFPYPQDPRTQDTAPDALGASSQDSHSSATLPRHGAHHGASPAGKVEGEGPQQRELSPLAPAPPRTLTPHWLRGSGAWQ